MYFNFKKSLVNSIKGFIFASAKVHGTLAQLVEQRTENPCVPGSIPGGTTNSEFNKTRIFLQYIQIIYFLSRQVTPSASWKIFFG